MPMPSAPRHATFGAEDGDELLSEAAPVVEIEDERDDGAYAPASARAFTPSLEPEESFADVDASLQEDRAPAAPITSRRGASLQADPVEATPPRAGSLAPFHMGREDEPEPTIVGKVPESLLELSSTVDENTRSFTAPRELIELARRERGDYSGSTAPAAIQLRDTHRPERGAVPPDAELDGAPPVPAESAAPPISVESEPLPIALDGEAPRGSEEDAAPPVALTRASEMEAVARAPQRELEEAPSSSGPFIEVVPGSEISLTGSFVGARGPAAASEAPASVVLPSALRSGPSWKRGALVIGAFVLIGIAISRWPDIVHLLR